jgi:hypothetical protein
MDLSGVNNMGINTKNLTPNVFQSSYSTQQSRKPVTSNKSYPVMGATKTPVQTVQSYLQPYSPATSVAKAKTATTQPNMSVAPKTTTVQPKQNTSLQSGYGAQYGNNPYNQPAAKPAATSQNVNSWMTGVNALNERTSQFYNDSEDKRTALANKQYQDSLALQNEMYGNANSDLKAQIPMLDERFGKFEQGVRANMAEADTIGATQKANAQTYTGSAQRTAMENKRQTDAQREKQYAALGTIDSYGTGSFTQGNANADTAFNRDTAQRYDALSQNLTSIDSTIANAKRDALSLIDQEKMKYEDSVRAINTQLRDNDVARRGAIQQAYYATQESINNISDQYEGLRIAQEQQKLTFQQEMAKLTEQNTMPNVSDWFKQTGQPQTTEDFNFIYKKPEAATALQKMLGGTEKKQTETGMKFSLAAKTAQQALDSLDAGLANTGKSQVVSSAVGKFVGDQSTTQTDYETKLAAARGVALNALSGAAVSPSEYKRLADMIPNLSDEPQIAKQKLSSFVQIMNMYGQNMNQTTTELSQDQIQQIMANMPQS